MKEEDNIGSEANAFTHVNTYMFTMFANPHRAGETYVATGKTVKVSSRLLIID